MTTPRFDRRSCQRRDRCERDARHRRDGQVHVSADRSARLRVIRGCSVQGNGMARSRARALLLSLVSRAFGANARADEAGGSTGIASSGSPFHHLATLTSNVAATARQLAPPKTAATTRSQGSREEARAVRTGPLLRHGA